jgi:hypothetical protein
MAGTMSNQKIVGHELGENKQSPCPPWKFMSPIRDFGLREWWPAPSWRSKLYGRSCVHAA